MIRRSIRRATTAVTARTIPITSRRCHSSMASDSTAARVFLSRRAASAGMAAMRAAALAGGDGGASPPLNFYAASQAPERGRRRRLHATTSSRAAGSCYGLLLASSLRSRRACRAASSSRLRRAALLGPRARAGAGRPGRDLRRRRRHPLALGRRRRAEPDAGGLGRQPRGRLCGQLRRDRADRAGRGGAALPRRRHRAPAAATARWPRSASRPCCSASGTACCCRSAPSSGSGSSRRGSALRTDSLYPSLLVHVAFNAFGMIVPLLV